MLALKESLFGNTALIREWGRTSTQGQRRVELLQQSRSDRGA
ncbi:WGR domain-containing protein [Microvirga vignae]